MTSLKERLLTLAHDLGDSRHMAICGEGNISGQLGEGRLLVKASGTRLGSLRPSELVEVEAQPILAALESSAPLSNEEVNTLLLSARADRTALKPSVETLFHAWLLSLPTVRFVGHVHAIAVNQVLASPMASEFALRRIIPDQVVYCGAESVLVPYVDPGLALARHIRERVTAFIGHTGVMPKTVLLKSHGIIACGATHMDVMAALAMAEKAAAILVGAASLGGPVFMDPHEVARIAGRADEHYRQAMLKVALA